ncbi:MAG: TonB-dependent receptor [Pseudomonadales bacterium]|nr:TonB-dependent receptor [Pseudomonadales bacterium]MCP5182625.1 TonB-dependent receptor [Pseudomonadales bacterium]
MHRLFCLIAFSICLAMPARADDSLEDMLEMSFDELMDFEVVTPTRTAMKLSQTPGSVTVITYDQIRRSPAQTIPELLRTVAGMNVRWNPMVQTIDVRGFGSSPFSSEVLLMIDGVPYNSWNKAGFPQHPGFDFFNIANVKHIEIVRGPGSALYGENAFNGIINIVTLSGSDDNSTSVRSTVGDRHTRSLSFSTGTRLGTQGSAFLGARKLRSQLPSSLWNKVSDSEAEGYDLFTKLVYGPFQATYYRLADKFDGFYEALDPALGFPPGSDFHSADTIEQKVNIVGLQYDKSADDGRWSIKANASYANRWGSHCAACHSPDQHEDLEKPEPHGNQKYVHAQIGWHGFEHHDLLAGYEIRRMSAGKHSDELEGSDELALPHMSDDVVLKYTKKSFFLQDRMHVLDDRLQIIGGVRFEGATSPELFGRATYPRLSLVYQPTERLTLRSGLGMASRYPSFSELYQASWFLAASTPFGPIPLATFEPNANLKPERIRTVDLGVEWHPDSHWQIKVDAFRNEIDRHIHIAYPRFRFENHDQRAIVSGFEADVRYQPWQRLSMYLNYAFQHNGREGNGRNSVGDVLDFSYAPRHKLNAGFSYSPTPHLTATADVSWKSRYKAPEFWYPITFGPTARYDALDDYAFANVKLTYNLPFLESQRRPLRISLVGRNLLDKEPYETLTGSGGTIAGREFYLQLEYRWDN